MSNDNFLKLLESIRLIPKAPSPTINLLDIVEEIVGQEFIPFIKSDDFTEKSVTLFLRLNYIDVAVLFEKSRYKDEQGVIYIKIIHIASHNTSIPNYSGITFQNNDAGIEAFRNMLRAFILMTPNQSYDAINITLGTPVLTTNEARQLLELPTATFAQDVPVSAQTNTKNKCRFCNSDFNPDSRGNCASCGGQR